MTTTRTPVEPTGVEHTFGVDELFFSYTDRRGVIEQANSTFVRLSHYSREELVGSPHNIIRHPGMPGGAFKLVWDELEAGRPACAYVDNLAQDGGHYWVFATLLPLGEGYLSVRMRPLARTYWDAARNLYTFANGAERTARGEGKGSRESAVAGAETITHGLGALGLGSFEELSRSVLPAEVAEHARVSAGLPERPGATGPLADVLDAMLDLDDDTDDLLAQLGEYAEVAAELRQTAGSAGPTLDRLTASLASAQEGAAQVSDRVPDLGQLAQDMGERAATAATVLTTLPARLHGVEDLVSRLRLRIALLRLHDIMVATFATELIDSGADMQQGADTYASMRLLAQALAEGAEAVAADVDRVREEVAAVPDEIRSAVREVDRFRRPLYKWQSFVQEGGVEAEMGEYTRRIEAQTEQGFGELERLSALAARLRLLDVPFDRAVVDERIDIIREALDRV